MFSRSKRFTDTVGRTPAVGQYDISKGTSTHTGAVLFPKDKRFKEPAITNDGNLLDISSCSTASTTSNGPLNNGVFVTPVRKTSGKVKSKELTQSVSNDELTKLSAKIAELQKEIEKLRTENEMLQKLKDDDLSKGERQATESNLTVVKEQVEKLRKQIEDEMERNKELVYQQGNYECSLKTMQADLELANSQVTALQQQIDYLEKTNADMAESREELENQCSKLHGMNIVLQEEKLAFQDRLDEIETNWKNACSTKEELSADLVSCRERHQFEIETLEQSLKEKVTTVEELTEERRSLEGTVESYKNKMCHLKLEMDESLKNQTETIDKLKIEKETLVASVENMRNKHEQTKQEMLQLQEVTTRKEELNLANLEKCQNLEDAIVTLQESQKSLTSELKVTKTNLEETKREFEATGAALKEMTQDHDNVCHHRAQLERDLQNTTQEKNILEKQLTQTQTNVDILQQNEKEQTSMVEILRREVEALKKENETIQTELTEHNRNEVGNLKDQLQKMQQENSSLAAAQEKANKLKQEFGRRLIEAQKGLSQKDMEIQNQRKDLDKLRLEYEGEDSWKRKFEELEEKIAPFQEQLDAFELEKQALLNRNTESQSEIDKLGQQYARLLGHQNQKQKIRHVQKLKDENTTLKKEVAKLRGEVDKEKFGKKRVEERLAKATGTRRFDPSLAFKHSVLENKENTPLKQHP